MKPTGIMLVLALCLGYLPSSLTAADWISISGYYKNYSVAFNRVDIDNLPSYDDQPMIGAVNNRLRLALHGRIQERVSLDLAYDFSPRIQDRSLFAVSPLSIGISTAPYRAVDFDRRLYPDENDEVASFAVFQNVDRAFVTVAADFADFYIGRQAVAWGSARIINPTDIISPYAFDELDLEDRIGVDAVRVRIPLGLMGEIDGGYVFGDDFDYVNSALFLRGRVAWRGNDISLVTAGFRNNLMIGCDLARAIGGAGLWVEAAGVFAGALDSDGRISGDDYFSTSVGLDYSLRNGTYMFCEYHFNGAGTTEPDNYLFAAKTTAYRDGSVYLLGRHYLGPGIIWQMTPLITLTGQSLVNLTDPSTFIMSRGEYNIAEDIYLSAGAYFGFGKSPKVISSHGLILYPGSEFGLYPDSYFMSFRVYF